jgi:monoamine oxidase
MQEMYDHSTFDNTGFALKAFLNGGSYTLTAAEEKKKRVIKQLSSRVQNVAYHEKYGAKS